MLRRHVPWATLATMLWQLAGPSSVLAYSVAVRWTGSDDPAIAGYNVHVTPEGGAERAPINLARPPKDFSGQFVGVVDDLDMATTYVFAISAYDANGQEGARSNEYTIGYAQAAEVVDSDHDGLTDAQEDRNLNLRRDAGETDRLVPDGDHDGVPDGLEASYGSDPFDAHSPSCTRVGLAAWRRIGQGAVDVTYDTDLHSMTVTTTPWGARPTGVGVAYPGDRVSTLADPVLVAWVRGDGPFRIDVRVRSTDDRVFRLRYEGHGHVDRVSRRRLRLNLGDHFTAGEYQPVGIDVAATIAALDPTAVFAAIERVTVRGALTMQPLRSCH